MFKHTLFVSLALIIACVAPSLAAEVGVKQIKVPAPERQRDLDVTVWYPARADGELTKIGDNRLFVGAEASLNASILAGKHPLILLSHGSGGRAEGMAWLASKLAKDGFIVAGPNHPGTTSGDSTPANTPKIWERTQDISALIDYFSTDNNWTTNIDAGQISTVGFSLGGTATMELAGAIARLEDYAQYCDQYKKWDCKWLTGGVGYVDGKPVKVEKLDLRTIDKASFEQSNLDKRIRSAVVIDPGLVKAYDMQSLSKISIPMHYINLGTGTEIPEGVIADKLAAATPKASYATIVGADHFSFLPVCKEGASDFMKSVGEVDPICTETGLRSRTDIHAELVTLVRDKLVADLKP